MIAFPKPIGIVIASSSNRNANEKSFTAMATFAP
jgi:hypothetical protein